jgi:hypothetical protein
VFVDQSSHELFPSIAGLSVAEKVQWQSNHCARNVIEEMQNMREYCENMEIQDWHSAAFGFPFHITRGRKVYFDLSCHESGPRIAGFVDICGTSLLL